MLQSAWTSQSPKSANDYQYHNGTHTNRSWTWCESCSFKVFKCTNTARRQPSPFFCPGLLFRRPPLPASTNYYSYSRAMYRIHADGSCLIYYNVDHDCNFGPVGYIHGYRRICCLINAYVANDHTARRTLMTKPLWLGQYNVAVLEMRDDRELETGASVWTCRQWVALLRTYHIVFR